jgi:hypothetical protein
MEVEKQCISSFTTRVRIHHDARSSECQIHVEDSLYKLMGKGVYLVGLSHIYLPPFVTPFSTPSLSSKRFTNVIFRKSV